MVLEADCDNSSFGLDWLAAPPVFSSPGSSTFVCLAGHFQFPDTSPYVKFNAFNDVRSAVGDCSVLWEWGPRPWYLKNVKYVTTAHVITHLYFSPSNIILFMGSDGVIHCIDHDHRRVTTATTIRTHPRPPMQLRELAFAVSADERWLADWHYPGTILIWDLGADRMLPSVRWEFQLPTPSRRDAQAEVVLAATFASHYNTSLTAVSSHGRLWHWDITKGIPLCPPVRLCRLSSFSSSLPAISMSTVTFSQDGSYLAWISPDRASSKADVEEHGTSLVVFDISDPSLIRRGRRSFQLRGNGAGISVFSFSRTGLYVVTGSASVVQVWRTHDASCIQVFTEHFHWTLVTHLVMSNDGNLLVSGGNDGSVCVRNIRGMFESAGAQLAPVNVNLEEIHNWKHFASYTLLLSE
ncbi:WD40-repeat-containing domain protein [Daedaleopsis nitida]|nr:WD40-repeat-containing domain protein [Daedaleopsis nitida]